MVQISIEVMKAALLLLGVCLLSAALAASAKEATSVSATQREFDYFILVRQWAGSFCSEHECPLVHIHG